MTEEELNDKIDAWHNDYTLSLKLHEYLGWTLQQYKDFIEKGVMPDV